MKKQKIDEEKIFEKLFQEELNNKRLNYDRYRDLVDFIHYTIEENYTKYLKNKEDFHFHESFKKFLYGLEEDTKTKVIEEKLDFYKRFHEYVKNKGFDVMMNYEKKIRYDEDDYKLNKKYLVALRNGKLKAFLDSYIPNDKQNEYVKNEIAKYERYIETYENFFKEQPTTVKGTPSIHPIKDGEENGMCAIL